MQTNSHGIESIGRFELVRLLGKGSQGAVYLARDPALDRHVAIKILAARQPELASRAPDGSPLEGRIASRLRHPNIVSVFDAGDCDGGPYLVFEYVQGKTLGQTLEANGSFPIAKASWLMLQILDALATAHESGILHLDLSPRNIQIGDDEIPRIMDFGLSQFVHHTPKDQKVAIGTLRYMAPEHFLGGALGPYTDVFALGSTFYELVTGKRAMAGNTIVEIQKNIVTATVDLGALGAFPQGDAFARFLAGALEKNHDGRYADCRVMREAFHVFLAEAGLEERVYAAGSQHSTVEFLLRRMQRKQDFPTISRTLADINRLTGDDNMATADKLANVILRDFALTSKLLKLVNSAFYGTRSVEITSISQAVVFLGVEQVRMTANSLSLFGHLQGDGDSGALKDSMTKSFLSGLIARHLAQRARHPAAEEAFICGMFQNLGENLVIYYFAEEYREIRELMSGRGLDKEAASRGVLGVAYSDLGIAVAKTWQLPDSIVAAIRGMPFGVIHASENDQDRLRDYAVFANELCDLALLGEPAAQDIALQMLLERFGPSVPLSESRCLTLLRAGLEKLNQFSAIFEINVKKSRYCRAVQAWLDLERDADTNAGDRAESVA